MRVSNTEVINNVSAVNLLSQSEFTIEDGSKLIEMILDSVYKDPITATVKDICQNASEVDPNFSVHLPTDFEPWFAVIDNGTGLSKENLIRYASGIGASTKDKDNTKVGGFGIGMKVPFTMSDQYTIIDRYEGKRYTFSAYKDEYGKAQFIEMCAAQDTTEPNGLEIRVPVKANAFHNLKHKFVSALSYFDPKPQTNYEVEWGKIEYTMSGKGWGIRVKENYREVEGRLIMGNLWYIIDNEQIRETWGDLYDKVLKAGIDLTLPIGSVQLPLSREGLLYTPKTIEVIRKKIDEIVEEVKLTYQVELDKQPNVWEAMRWWKESSSLLNTLGIKDIKYKGTEVNGNAYVAAPYYRSYIIPKQRWRFKSFTLGDYSEGTHTINSVVLPVVLHCFSYIDRDKFVLYVAAPSTKRLPSRLCQHMNEPTGSDEKQARIVMCDNDGDEAMVVQWLKDTFGLDAEVFDDVVDEYKPVRYKKGNKKSLVVKCLKYDMSAYAYYDNAVFWLDENDLDLDNSTGIWVDVRNRDVHGSKVHSNKYLKDIIRSLEKGGFIPEDTAVYGCPGSVKNRLKDHPNFMWLDDVIETALETANKLISDKDAALIQYNYALDQFTRASHLKLDMTVKQGYYKDLSSRHKKFKENKKLIEKDKMFYTMYNLLRSNYIDTKRYNLGTYTDALNQKFFKKYPLLKFIDVTEESHPSIEDYINMKETCNV
jgi:hypothetical protein